MPLTETLSVTREVVSVFEAIGVPCIVGGSVASSLHGIPRATQDVDLLAILRAEHVPRLIGRLKDEYYVDELAVRDAIKREASFNVIHLETMYKVDVFVCGRDELKMEEFRRAVSVVIDDESGDTLRVADASDIVVQKLIWYDLGGRVSQRQWDDVIGVLRVSGGALDLPYLGAWAQKKGVFELLARAFEIAGLEFPFPEDEQSSDS